MVAAVAVAAAAACTPIRGLGSVAYARGGAVHVVDLGTCRERTEPLPKPRATLVSPDGTRRVTVRFAGATQAIRVSDGSGAGRDVLSLPRWSPNGTNRSPGPIMLLGWSGDSRWVFYAIDPMGSASIVADGVFMRAVPAAGGSTRAVAAGLAYPDYRTWCGGRLVLTAGGDRIATHGKRLVVASPPGWRATPLVGGAGRAWGSLVCAPDDTSVVVQSQPATGVDMSSDTARWSLWRVGLDGTQRRLTTPPPGDADESPRLAADGRTILFVRSHKGVGKLYALRDGTLLGPLLDLGYQLGYYGHRAWWR